MPPSSKTWLYVAGGVALLGAVGLAVIVGGPKKESPHAAVPAPSITEGLTEVDATLTSTPPGAVIRVDGVDTGKVTPAAVTLKTGREHLIVLDHPEFLLVQTKVFAAPRTPVTLNEKLLPGSRVTVKTTPPGADVSVDGEGAFRSSEASRALPLGKHIFVATLAGHVPVRRELELVVVAPKLLELTLFPAAEVEVTSTPDGAAIWVDGVDSTQTTPATVAIPADMAHLIAVRKPKYGEASRRLAGLPKGGSGKVDLTLELAQGKVLTRKIKSLEGELAVWETRVARLRESESGMIVDRSLKKELAHRNALDAAEKKVADLESDLGALREELERVLGDGK